MIMVKVQNCYQSVKSELYVCDLQAETRLFCMREVKTLWPCSGNVFYMVQKTMYTKVTFSTLLKNWGSVYCLFESRTYFQLWKFLTWTFQITALISPYCCRIKAQSVSHKNVLLSATVLFNNNNVHLSCVHQCPEC